MFRPQPRSSQYPGPVMHVVYQEAGAEQASDLLKSREGSKHTVCPVSKCFSQMPEQDLWNRRVAQINVWVLLVQFTGLLFDFIPANITWTQAATTILDLFKLVSSDWKYWKQLESLLYTTGLDCQACSIHILMILFLKNQGEPKKL